MDNSGRTILVTGASTGIGLASAHALAAAGFDVVAGVRSADAARSVVEGAPASAHGRITALEIDVTDGDGIGRAVARLEAGLGERGLWGLFNNAGIAVSGPIEFVALDRLREQFEVNVFGQVAITQTCLPLLRRARGRILLTGSIAGFGTVPGLGPYSMSKHAVEALADALRRELRPWGMQVSLLEPGSIATEIWRKGAEGYRAARSVAPAGLVELYGPLLERLNEFAADAARNASPVDVVTRAVVHAFSDVRPRTRYCMGHGSGQRKLLRRLPDRWVDAVFSRALGWG
ncbi:MAG: SDR family NAD(P)-dependent oxidoreductase [Steroidobacteraceae bacterium]